MTIEIEFLKSCIDSSFKWTHSQRKYVLSHMSLYHTLLQSDSAEEFMMNFEMMKFSMTFPLIDYIALFAGGLSEAFLLWNIDRMPFNDIIEHLKITPILVKLVEKFNVFDDVIKTSAFPRALLSMRSVYHNTSLVYKLIELVLSKMFDKYPDLFDKSFNYYRRKGYRIQRFSKSDMEKYLKYAFD